MIFLGAGASAPFGPKPYSCITKEVWNVLHEHNVEEICSTAQAKLTSDKIVFDFEAILTIFEFLKDSSRGITEAGLGETNLQMNSNVPLGKLMKL